MSNAKESMFSYYRKSGFLSDPQEAVEVGFDSFPPIPSSFPKEELEVPAMASPRLELKQSSLDSFFRKSPSCIAAGDNDMRPVTDAPQVTASTVGAGSASSSSLILDAGGCDAAAEYEKARLENIRRNRDFLLNLGISAGVHAPKSDLRRQGKRIPRASPVSYLPLRRSARKRPFSSSSIEEKEEERIESAEPPSPTHVDSTVLQYTCRNAGANIQCPLPSSLSTSPSSSPVLGYRIAGKALRCRSLTKIYTMDVRCLNGEKALVAAGGHGGAVSLFGVDLIKDEGEDAAEGEIEEPLMSWKASKSWISGVFFMDDNPMLLVSSSNDGKIVIWDVSKQPPLESSSWSLHSGGIFSMHHLEHSIVTASKDSSVVISTLEAGGQLVAERTISGHHSGAIRGVCFRETKQIIADGGADGRLCVLDGRSPEACTLAIESNHQTHINSVEWCLSNVNLLLSASKDTALRLYDIRNPREAVLELRGHVGSGSEICRQIYKPTFVNNGSMVATPGEGSRKISLFCMGSGNLVSQGLVGYDANLVFFTGENFSQPRVWTTGKQINQLCGVAFAEL